jgi:hypothetical protein
MELDYWKMMLVFGVRDEKRGRAGKAADEDAEHDKYPKRLRHEASSFRGYALARLRAKSVEQAVPVRS